LKYKFEILLFSAFFLPSPAVADSKPANVGFRVKFETF